VTDSSPPRSRKLARQRRKLHRTRTPIRSRRRFMVQGIGLLAAGVGVLTSRVRASPREIESGGGVPVRPPTASHDDAVFRAKCISCGLCGTVCESGCIRFYGLDEVGHGPLTPYLDVRRRSCTLCMRCTQICPTDALRHVEEDLETVKSQVDMGTAVVERDLCLSYQGRLCGYCHDACPLPGTAIKLVPPAIPVIQDGCVGCGMCVEFCPQAPTAIRVQPAGRR
jgi:ferredoxin-type protein NapG